MRVERRAACLRRDDALSLPLIAYRRFQHAGGIAGDDGMRWHIFCDDAAGTDQRTLTNGDAAEDRGVRTDRGTLLYQGFDAGPVCVCLQTAGGGRRAGEEVVGEHDTMTDENLVFDRHAFADETMRGDFAAASDLRSLLNFDKGPDLGLVANFATVEIRECENTNVLSEFDVGCDLAVGKGIQVES